MRSLPRTSVALCLLSVVALAACGEPFAGAEAGAGGASSTATTTATTATTAAGGAGQGGGAAGGHAPGGAGQGGGAACASVIDCIAPGPCATVACVDGACVESAVASATPLPAASQTPGDCRELRCDGAGKSYEAPADADVPPQGPDLCKTRGCADGGIVDAPAAPGTPCSNGQTCDGAGACVECYPGGPACVPPATCSAGHCVAPLCQNGSKDAGEADVDCGGSCPPCGDGRSCGGAVDCASRFCDGGICAPCVAHGDCGAGQFCPSDTHVCTPTSGPGVACASDAECAAGACADGVCCNQKCDGPCQECASKPGTCQPVADGAGDPACPVTEPTTCGTTGHCAGGACERYPKSTFCGVDCNFGKQVTRTCDGAGTCVDGAPKACTPYVCSGTVCATSCSTDAGCTGNAFCDDGGLCKLKKPVGSGCKTGSECLSGVCGAGVCV